MATQAKIVIKGQNNVSQAAKSAVSDLINGDVVSFFAGNIDFETHH